jgi:enoyl-CoA hydratase/carnithine racemase
LSKTDIVVETTRRGAAVVATITRPQVRNTLNAPTCLALLKALASAEADPAVRALVVTGAETAFCSGGDPLPDQISEQRIFARAYRALHTGIDEARVPVIAAINGDCVAGGMAFLETCDIAIAVETARFGYPEIKVGGFPMLAMVLGRESLARKRFLELAFTGDTLSAQRAFEIGLVNRVVAASELWPTIDAFVEQLGRVNAEALTLGRQTMAKMRHLSRTAAFDLAEDVLIASRAEIRQQSKGG